MFRKKFFQLLTMKSYTIKRAIFHFHQTAGISRIRASAIGEAGYEKLLPFDQVDQQVGHRKMVFPFTAAFAPTSFTYFSCIDRFSQRKNGPFIFPDGFDRILEL